MSDAVYQVSVISAIQFPRRRFLKFFFTIYGHGSHLGHVTSTVLINSKSEGSIYNLTSVYPVASEQKLFEINEIRVTLDNGQRMTLTSGTCIPTFSLLYISTFIP